MWLPTISSGFLKVITSGLRRWPGATSKPSRVKSSWSMRICVFSKAESPVNRALRVNSPSIAARAKARARWPSVASSAAPFSAASSPATMLFSASCGVSNRKSGSGVSLTGSPSPASGESR